MTFVNRLTRVALGFMMLVACQSTQATLAPTQPPAVTLTLLPSPPPTVVATRLPSPLAVTAPASASAPSPSESPTAPAAAWRFWLAASQPLAVYALAMERGTLWAGTSFGIWRIDPSTGAYIADQTQGQTQQLLPVDDGVWAVGRDSLYYFDGQTWIKTGFDFGPLSFVGASYTLGMDPAGDMWLSYYAYRSFVVASYPGHVARAGVPWTNSRAPNASQSGDARECGYWQAVASGGYVYRSEAECQTLRSARQAISAIAPDYALLAIDADGSVWWTSWATGSTLGHLLPDGSSTTQDLSAGRVYALAAEPTHGVWIATEQGLAFSDGASVRRVSLGLDAYTLRGTPRNIAVDTQGNAWVITSDGVYRLAANEARWRPVTDFGLQGDSKALPLGTIAAAREGGMWATHGWDVWRFGGASSTTPVTAPLGENCSLVHLAVDAAGNVWSLAQSCGIYQFNPVSGEWAQHFPGSFMSELTFGADGSVFALGPEGLWAKAPGAGGVVPGWELIAANSPDLYGTIAADGDGGVWFSSNGTGELRRYHDGQVTSHGLRFRPYGTNRMHVDGQARLWIADVNDLAVYDGRDWQRIPMPNIGPAVELIGDDSGRIWIGGIDGVAVYDPAD